MYSVRTHYIYQGQEGSKGSSGLICSFILLLRRLQAAIATNKTPIHTDPLLVPILSLQNQPTNKAQPYCSRSSRSFSLLLVQYVELRKKTRPNKMPSQPQPQQREREQQRHELPVGPTRWCPTPEQLMILEEMYRGGLRTPNASQIQQITAHLSTYGRIEGKNVFYWFQNHKARDRQKLRRRLCMSHHLLSSCAAAHYYYGHGGGHGGFHLAAPPPTTVPFGGVGVFDQALLSPTSPTPAAAAAAAYGYYYPTTAAFAAPPASRCAGSGATTPPSPNQQQLFHHYLQGAGGGCVAPAEAALGQPEYSLGKLDNFGVALDDVVSAAAATVDMGPPGFEVAPPPPAAFCRPLKTLDLFPGGLKEEQRDVA